MKRLTRRTCDVSSHESFPARCNDAAKPSALKNHAERTKFQFTLSPGPGFDRFLERAWASSVVRAKSGDYTFPKINENHGGFGVRPGTSRQAPRTDPPFGKDMRKMTAAVGQQAPDFTVKAYDRGKSGTDAQFRDVSLADYKRKWVCLFFYPLDFTFVCPTEIVAFNKALDDFEDRNCVVMTASTDSVYSHKGWCDSHDDLKKLRYLMLADTTHELSRKFGVLKEDQGIAYRGVFLIDPNGVVRWMAIHDLGVGRNVDEVLRVLDALQTDKLCPCNWKKGEQTIN